VERGTDTPLILIADDQPDVLEALKLLLKAEGFTTETATSPAGVLDRVGERAFDAVLMDLNYTRDTTSGREGFDLLTRLHDDDPTLPVIVMTAWSSVEGAVEAMRRGARDYIEKPWENARLLATLKTQVELGDALRRTRRLEDENRHLRREGIPPLVTESPLMQEVVELATRIAPSDANVLITGEHGTGKEVMARWIHAASERAERPLITLNAGALPEGLVESELFGHVKGAFTDARTDRAGCFELADSGTLFLDEIANVPPAQQAKLLRVLETGEIRRVGSEKMRLVDVRVISATNVDPVEAVADGSFREDLLYRLNTVEIHLPPLRQRREDISHLADTFLAELNEHYDRSLTGFTSGARALMQDHPWPGNIRELRHAVERAVLMARSEQIDADDLTLRQRDGSAPELETKTLEEAEEYLISRCLERTGGNVSRAAEELGLSRSALYRRLQRFGLQDPE